ncbi:MAG: hypothetical protein P8O16_15975 [Algoriphagus sp.]|uniref:hypothetical protein n=1 Tax=Algoriphagus sp. TaxID=1872435 RepID=UPI002616B3EE|nr:hypothetical protein [Algoriphagus sp.]MDG1278780.1 hypothetical protein [Algoriphagus sp.]
MRYFRILPASLLLLFFTSCEPSLVEQNKEKRAEVIAVHDEVMPKMGTLKNLEKEVQAKIEALEMSENPDLNEIENLKALAFDLNAAYEGMFVWMRQYSIEDEGKSPEEIKLYLEEQMVKVNEVNADIKAALEKAQEVLKD